VKKYGPNLISVTSEASPQKAIFEGNLIPFGKCLHEELLFIFLN